MSVIRMGKALSVTLVCLLALSACGSGPPPKLYLLELPAVAELQIDASSINVLGISQITVPGYASDARIASRETNGVITQRDNERWAEDPEQAITRLLASRLKVRAGATVLVEPWPRDYQPQARVEVMFDRLLRQPDGGAHLAGQIQLLSGDGRKVLQVVLFNYRIEANNTNARTFFTSVAQGVDAIAIDAIEALLASGRS